jgi:hypothetical protein
MLDDFIFFVSKNTGSLRQDFVKPMLSRNIRVMKNWTSVKWRNPGVVKCM